MKNFEEKARAYALKNAISYKGKANSGAVISALFNEGLDKKDLKEKAKEINLIVAEVNKLSLEEQEIEFAKVVDFVSSRKIREGLPELPHAEEGKIVMRFAPSPSGPMHIGHAITASISYLFCKEYDGKFYFRIEDTNPENIYPPAYEMLKDEADWLFEKKCEFVVQSNNMKNYYKKAEELIKRGFAYVCICSQEDFKKLADKKISCPCRDLDRNEHLKRWKKMLDKKGFKEGEAVLRFRTPEGMKHPNPAMRDFPLARINLTSHPLQKKKYRVWPLMNLAVAVDDIDEKMTHTIRAKDHRDNAKRQELIFKALGHEPPWTGFLGRYHFTDLTLSASQFRKDVESKKYSGWDDPKLPTIASIKKQGYKPEAFWKLAEKRGISEADKKISKKEFFQLLKTYSK